MKRLLIAIILSVATLVPMATIAQQKSQKLYKGVEIVSLEQYTFKGMTSFLISAKLRNSDNVEYTMESGRLVLMLNGETVATMSQSEAVRLPAGADGEAVTSTLWNIEQIDPMNLMMLTVQLSQKNYAGLSFSYDVTFGEGGKKREYSKKGVDLEKFLTIFAPTI